MHIDFSDMNQRHLFIAYAFAWTVQLGYAGWIGSRWWKLRQVPTLPPAAPEN